VAIVGWIPTAVGLVAVDEIDEVSVDGVSVAVNVGIPASDAT
jgi:hypothetical protein